MSGSQNLPIPFKLQEGLIIDAQHGFVEAFNTHSSIFNRIDGKGIIVIEKNPDGNWRITIDIENLKSALSADGPIADSPPFPFKLRLKSDTTAEDPQGGAYQLQMYAPPGAAFVADATPDTGPNGEPTGNIYRPIYFSHSPPHDGWVDLPPFSPSADNPLMPGGKASDTACAWVEGGYLKAGYDHYPHGTGGWAENRYPVIAIGRYDPTARSITQLQFGAAYFAHYIDFGKVLPRVTP